MTGRRLTQDLLCGLLVGPYDVLSQLRELCVQRLEAGPLLAALVAERDAVVVDDVIVLADALVQTLGGSGATMQKGL
jgi:hypothetical protein